MVKIKKENKSKKAEKQGQLKTTKIPVKINAQTQYEFCETRMTAYGGLLAFTKFIDLVKYQELFEKLYCQPSRKAALGCYRMVLGIQLLLIIGFARIGQFSYIRHDAMVCGMLLVNILPAICTFWRYIKSLGLNQSQSLVNIGANLRNRVWQICCLHYEVLCIVIDTTVSTVYGKIEGSRKGHNTKHRGKKGLRPVLLFIEQTREYLCGTQRRGTTMTDKEIAVLVRKISQLVPSDVKKIIVKGDAEFIGAETLKACFECGFEYVFGNRRCAAEFAPADWYSWNGFDYNETQYKPAGWDKQCRFVVMRISKDKQGTRQEELFDKDNYAHRVFVTNMKQKPHKVIVDYDQRATVESMIKESQQEGILAIPSKRFLTNHAFFQIVMLTYNMWRWIKLVAGIRPQSPEQTEVKAMEQKKSPDTLEGEEIVSNTIRIARLKILFVPAKIVTPARQTTVRYSQHDERAAGIIDLLTYIDKQRTVWSEWPQIASVTT